jgi:hypothetical protein
MEVYLTVGVELLEVLELDDPQDREGKHCADEHRDESAEYPWTGFLHGLDFIRELFVADRIVTLTFALAHVS